MVILAREFSAGALSDEKKRGLVIRLNPQIEELHCTIVGVRSIPSFFADAPWCLHGRQTKAYDHTISHRHDIADLFTFHLVKGPCLGLSFSRPEGLQAGGGHDARRAIRAGLSHPPAAPPRAGFIRTSLVCDL